MRKERMDGIESKSRNRSIEDNLRIFNEMKLGTEEVYLCWNPTNFRGESTVSERRSQLTIRTKPSVILLSFDAMTPFTTAPGINIRCIRRTTSLVQSSTLWRALPMRCVL